jgi:3-oxoadipate enol-lactonase
VSGRYEIAHVAGTHLAYETAGTGPCVVLIHGFTLDARMWDDQFEVLTQRYRVMRYDMRGFGQSAIPDGTGYTPAADLKALLEYLLIDSAAILGLSLGGGVALDFAVNYPESTRALILVDAMVDGWAWSAEWTEESRAVWMAARESGTASAKERWLAHPLFRPARQKPDVARRLARMVADYSGWHWHNKDPRQHPRPSTMQRLAGITAPTLIMVGEQDVADFRALADAFARDIPHSRKVVMPGVGHMANLEDPEQFNALVRNFLDDC